LISFSDFEKVDMRVGVVVDAQEFPEARRPAYKLWIDFGPLDVKHVAPRQPKNSHPAATRYAA